MADKTNQKMLLVVNPVSGKKMAKQYMMRMINRFDQAGYNVTACCTQINKNAYEIVKNRGAEFDIIVCCGGDGTLKNSLLSVPHFSPWPLCSLRFFLPAAAPLHSSA